MPKDLLKLDKPSLRLFFPAESSMCQVDRIKWTSHRQWYEWLSSQVDTLAVPGSEEGCFCLVL